MNYCYWFAFVCFVLLVAATKLVFLRGKPFLPVMRRNWFFILLFFMTGLYFQFVIRVTQAKSFESLNFYFNGAIFAAIDSWISLLTIGLCTNVFFKKRSSRFLEIVFIFLLSMILFLVISIGLQMFLELYVWDNDFYLYRYFADSFIKTTIHTFYALGFLSFIYFRNYKESQQVLYETKSALSETQLKLLHHQVDPHFLFNNLNVLASFIPDENIKAHKYLTNLAALYRYLLKSRDKDVVELQDELEQAQNYAYLIKERFGAAYDFEFDYKAKPDHAVMLPPLVIQELLVNAIKHNEAATDLPLKISVRVFDNEVEVINNLRRKDKRMETAKTGMGNLAARYRLLTDRPVECIETTESFLVRLPLLKLITGNETGNTGG